ncbi:tannase/feruloyl esterase family alpha/beta hydrolase [Leptothrix sp. BB-4]
MRPSPSSLNPSTTPAPAPSRTFGLCLLAASVASAVAACGGSDSAALTAVEPSRTASVNPVMACAALAGQTVAEVLVTSAVPVPQTATLPAYCKVNGTRTGTELDLEIRLPDTWTQRYVQQGGAGFDGSIPAVGTNNTALSLHAVQGATNGGHRDPSGAGFLHNPARIQLYAHTAIGYGTAFGKAVTARYYGRNPSYAYFEGCSNGGRGAFNAADKYGSQFDAVIAGAPNKNLPGLVEQWTRATQLSLPPADKLSAIHAAAVQKCDALDGATDGIISNGAACRFDPTVDLPASAGVTAVQAAAIRTLMTDLKLANGTTIYSGIGYGDLLQWGPMYAALGIGHMKNVVRSDANWNPATFSVDGDYAAIDSVTGGYGFSASTGGLASFLMAGKKIVIWHGSDDSLLSHRETIRTWQPVADAAGAAAQNARLYIASGVNHCGGGDGADTFDLLTPTMAWVEHGTDPGTPTASKLGSDGTVQFTRPLCQHPAYPKYKGSGDLRSAASYACSTS